MSSILKALKKLESERVSRQPGTLKIDSDILRSDASPSGNSTAAKILVALLLIAGGAGVNYLLMTRVTRPDKGSVLTVSQRVPPTPSEVSTPVSVPSREIIASDKVRNTASVNTPRAVSTTLKSTKKSLPETALMPEAHSSTRGHDVTPGQSATAHVPTSVVPLFRINGIAWQNNSAGSVAIVNGIPVSNGSAIDGAIVEEIRKDRVLFNFNGEKFEISLGQSNK